ncbi:hypothetical protein FNF29_05872 [Cafeteria roenbergensis]|uniref:Uncharacterized protein n=1 Tax=Cafeteria roenbergensis TaxID=33653 RepID=A0A5A8CCZ2_CAFRO|nr:hypothetical protein FNF29_05872 [Cafeteria roenbergensis]|eukprot:KAA0149661.1 hypothetical protein FNF29_05872 [Cafeteria roenbergensis]
MRAQEISMLLVGDHEDDDKVVGVFTEKCYKANVDHEAFPPRGEGAPDASKRVSSQESVLLSDVAAVVSVRDMLRHLLRVHSAALKRAEPPAAAAKSGAASTEGEQGEPEGPAAPASEATKAAWEALQRSAKALDTQGIRFRPVGDSASDSDAKLRAGAVEYFEALTAFAEGKTQQARGRGRPCRAGCGRC